MQWLIHNSLPGVAEALTALEHKSHAIEELALAPEATSEQILAAARAKQWDIITSDSSLALAPFDLPGVYNRCIVFLQLQGGETEWFVAISRLFERFKRPAQGRLYTVTGTRVKVRQLPSRK